MLYLSDVKLQITTVPHVESAHLTPFFIILRIIGIIDIYTHVEIDGAILKTSDILQYCRKKL